jgi:diacylglycerol O-acyltransferase / trehalose O-mycolyltransferase
VPKLKSVLVAVAAALGFALALPTPQSTAQPAAAPAGAHITGVEQVTDRWQKVSVFSPSMNTVIVNDVFRAPGGGAPIFYLLNGADGGVDNKGWFGLTNIPEFFGDKDVNVVSPIGGKSSFYTDWLADDPALGRNKWQTYLTQELPSLMDDELNSNGLNAIGGLSMSGGAALDLAIQAPGLYKAAGSYSGCPATSQGKQYTQTMLTVLGGGGNAANMWGPEGSPQWLAHDPSLNVAKLKGVAVYVAASAGGVGAVDKLPPGFPNPAGGLLVEGITLDCSRQFVDAANAAGVPVTFIVRPEGAHTWGLFDSEMRESWNLVIGPALGV